jgi:hypothetical protein
MRIAGKLPLEMLTRFEKSRASPKQKHVLTAAGLVLTGSYLPRLPNPILLSSPSESRRIEGKRTRIRNEMRSQA